MNIYCIGECSTIAFSTRLDWLMAGIYIDTTGKKATFNLYFDNNAPNAWNTTSSLISLRMPDEVYSRFIQTGLTDDDTIDVCLNVHTQTGTVTLEYKTALEDFMLP